MLQYDCWILFAVLKKVLCLTSIYSLGRAGIDEPGKCFCRSLFKGKPLGILDGVPVSVKDELDLLPLRHDRYQFYSNQPPEQDATSVHVTFCRSTYGWQNQYA
ncbi:MAG: hypothetical protein Ct9H300mP28_19480 [Pseudomonadota bacterium]|nr:MAG: hypothetical protein Ct9H300mP28_19480 [Pseudomonadota bacterium]